MVRMARFGALSLIAVPVLWFGLATPAAAYETMYISEDTTLTGDLVGSIFIVEDGVTLDCAGFTIYPDGESYYNGISLYNVDDVTVMNCVVDGGAMGIFAEGDYDPAQESYTEYATGLSFLNNTVRNSERWDGFRIQGVDGAIVSGNVAHDNARHGLCSGWGDNVVWTDNIAFDNGSAGIALGHTSYDNVLTGNAASGNAAEGFHAYGVTGVRFEANTATRNVTGFGISTSTDVTLVDNNVNRNRDFGFGINHGGDVVLDSNRATGNGFNGFALSNVDGGQLAGNLAVRNGSDGFGVWYSTFIVLDGNTALGNAGSGILMKYGSDHTLVDNTARGSGLDGIAIDSVDSTISFNVADGNAKYGFGAFPNSSGNTFSFNSASRNGEVDARDMTDDLNTWSDNDFRTTNGI